MKRVTLHCRHLSSRVRAGDWVAGLVILLLVSPLHSEELSLEAVRERLAMETSRPNWEKDAIPGRLFVHFRNDVTGPERSRALAGVGPRTRSLGVNELTGTDLVKVEGSADLASALQILRDDPMVEWAEPVWTRHLAVIPSDPRFGEQWALRNTGQESYGDGVETSYGPGTPGADIAATAAWDTLQDASSVIVAVLDTGADLNHPDLVANLWTNPDEIPGDGKDNDANGRIDDVHGYDFASARDSDNNIIFDADPSDIDGHGTAVAGIILAEGNNGIGVCGVAWHGQLMVVKVVTPDGGIGNDSLIRAYAYAGNNGARVVNASYVGYQYSSEEFSALNSLSTKGVLVVTAAGNNNFNMDHADTRGYPACYALPNIVSVASTQRNDRLSVFSNYGHQFVDLAAPGEGILTTLPNYDPDPASSGTTADLAFPQYDDDQNGFKEYGGLSGTSFASPMVAGAAALVLAANPGLTPAQVRERLIDSAERLDSLSPAATIGGGRLHLPSLLDFQNPYVSYAVPDVLIPGETTRVELKGVNLQTGATVTFSGAGLTGTVVASASSANTLAVDVVGEPLKELEARAVDVTVRNPDGSHSTQHRVITARGFGATYSDFTSVPIPDGGTAQSVVRTITVPDSITVASVELHLMIQHPYTGDLSITLRSPDGAEWRVVDRPGLFIGFSGADPTADISTWFPTDTFPPNPVTPLIGESAQGTWTLTVIDEAPEDIGTLQGWELRLAGEHLWNFAASPPVFDVPTTDQGSDFLGLQATSTNCLGFWHTEPNYTIASTGLFRVRFTVATEVQDPARVPLYRARFNSNDNQVAVFAVQQRNGTGPQTPTAAGTQVEWFTTPPPRTAPGDSTRYELAFDLMNFDSRFDPSGDLRFSDLTLERIPLTSLQGLRTEKSYSFDSGAQGWFSGSAAPVFTPPTFGSSGGSLRMTATNNSNTFGIWTSPPQPTLDPARLYRVRFRVATASPVGVVPTLRLRAGDSGQLEGVGLVVNSRGDNSVGPIANGRDYDVYYAPPQGLPGGLGLESAFDMLNFDPADDAKGYLVLQSMRVDSFVRP